MDGQTPEVQPAALSSQSSIHPSIFSFVLQCDGESIRSRVDPVSLNDACADVSVNDLSNSSVFGSVNKS